MTDHDADAVRRVAATPDPALVARIASRMPLRYRAGADPSLDRPAHVRAGSGVALLGRRLAVVQDDANFLALVEPRSGVVDAVPLPAGPGGLRQFDDGRANKADKLDLEARVAVPGDERGGLRLLAFGSGSTARRERVAEARGLDGAAPALDGAAAALDGAAAALTLHELPAFYAALRAVPAFAGSELNVEGVLYVAGAGGGPPRLRLFGRGNGAARGPLEAINATCDVDWRALDAHMARPADHPPPRPRAIVRYDLGAIGGVPLGFTDAASGPRGAVLYAAAAEASPDATRDGDVAGSALGVIVGDAHGSVTARWAVVRDAGGEPFAGKIEGLVTTRESPARCWAVVDGDDPAAPSELCLVELEGPWYG